MRIPTCHPLLWSAQTRSRLRSAGIAGVAGALLLLVTGCGGGAPSNAPAAPPDMTSPMAPGHTMAPGQAMPGQPTSGQPQASTPIRVQMTDYGLALPRRALKAGDYTFVAVNAGQVDHAIELDGPGVEDKRTEGIVAPGASAPLTVTLQPGQYEMYCPVGDHRERGMETTFTVTQ